MTDKIQAVEAAELTKRLRDACLSVRGKAYPLSELIPLMQKAADALDRPVAEVAAPVGGLGRMSWDYEAGCMRADENGPFVCYADVVGVSDENWENYFKDNEAQSHMEDLMDGQYIFRKNGRYWAYRTATQPAGAGVSVGREQDSFPAGGEVQISLTLSEARLLYTMANVSIESGGDDPDYLTLRQKAHAAKSGAAQPILARDAKDARSDSGHLDSGAGGEVHAPAAVEWPHDPILQLMGNNCQCKRCIADRARDAAILSSEQDQAGGGGRGV